MEDESEQALLMGNHAKSNSMMYTEGSKGTLEGISAVSPLLASATPLPENGESYGNGENPPTKDSSGRGSEQSQNSEILTELMANSGSTLMSQFHADALKQVGFGRYQLLMIIASGLALAAQVIQFFSIFFVFASLNLEFCLRPEQQNTLLSINLIGTALGAVITSTISDFSGRKRTLLICVLCMSIFSVVAAFMPTYQPFALARFIASIYGGAIFPVGVTYISEMSPGHMRGRSVGIFTSIGLGGAMNLAAVSLFVLPLTEEELFDEPKEHFSSWHSYLLLMTLSGVIPIISLLLLPESPRWLLEVGREVEALEIYQKIYRSNNVNGRYTFTELELPRMRFERHSPSKSLLVMVTKYANQFWDSHLSLFRASYRKTFFISIFIWFGTAFVSFGLISYALRNGEKISVQSFKASTLLTFNNTFENDRLTFNMINQHFETIHFINCTFDQMIMSHVHFRNCSFTDSHFHGVKTNDLMFINSNLTNVHFIDTYLEDTNFINCNVTNTELDEVSVGCEREIQDDIIHSLILNDASLGLIFPTLIAVIWCGEALSRFERVRLTTICTLLATAFCLTNEFTWTAVSFYWTTGLVQAAISAGLLAFTVYSVEFNSTSTRCTAMGILTCLGYLGANAGTSVYLLLPDDTAHIVTLVSIFILSFLCFICTFLKENSQLL